MTGPRLLSRASSAAEYSAAGVRCRRIGKRWAPSNPTTGPPPDRPPSAPSAGPPLPLRRLLRALAGTELWHIEEPRTRAQRIPSILYLVKRGGREATFSRPH